VAKDAQGCHSERSEESSGGLGCFASLRACEKIPLTAGVCWDSWIRNFFPAWRLKRLLVMQRRRLVTAVVRRVCGGRIAGNG